MKGEGEIVNGFWHEMNQHFPQLYFLLKNKNEKLRNMKKYVPRFEALANPIIAHIQLYQQNDFVKVFHYF